MDCFEIKGNGYNTTFEEDKFISNCFYLTFSWPKDIYLNSEICSRNYWNLNRTLLGVDMHLVLIFLSFLVNFKVGFSGLDLNGLRKEWSWYDMKMINFSSRLMTFGLVMLLLGCSSARLMMPTPNVHLNSPYRRVQQVSIRNLDSGFIILSLLHQILM